MSDAFVSVAVANKSTDAALSAAVTVIPRDLSNSIPTHCTVHRYLEYRGIIGECIIIRHIDLQNTGVEKSLVGLNSKSHTGNSKATIKSAR